MGMTGNNIAQVTAVAEVSDANLKFEEAFYRLFERRVALFTGEPDGTLPENTAYDLLESLCYLFDVDGTNLQAAADRYTGVDLASECARRIDRLETRAKALEPIWMGICTTTPPLKSMALRDTLAAIEGVWNRYDARFFPLDISCDIDYPLCHPVSESIKGLDYLERYLESLHIEVQLLQCFPVSSSEQVLACSCPDWRGLLVNLYEPVAARCIALSLAGHSLEQMEIDDAAYANARQCLEGLTPKHLREALSEAASNACRQIGVSDPDQIDYLARFATSLQPRITAGGFEGVFPQTVYGV
jgi:hypothetical protein